MKTLYVLLFAFFCFKSGEGYSKYGRTCKDIGCSSNEECYMAETPCSYYTRENECGMYPTCRKVSSSGPSCATYICPPTKKCIVDDGNAKCVDDAQANIPGNQNGNKAYQTYDTQNTNGEPSAPNQNPYPVLPGQTTTRPPMRRPGSSGGGYQGGSVGSGYPGQGGGGYQGGSAGSGYPGQGGGGYQGGNVGSGYPGQGGGGYQGGNVGSGYPGQGGGGYQGGSVGSGYPGGSSGFRYQGSSNNFGYQGGSAGSRYPSGYPQQGYPQQGYPQQGYNGYQQGYGQQGYGQQGYGSRGSYNNQNSRQPAQSSGSNPIYDTLKNTLSTYGTSLLKNALGSLKL